MDAFSEALRHGFLGIHAKHFFYTGTYKGVSALNVQDKNHIGETIHQPTRELLLLMQIPLDFAARGDIHQRTLIPDNFPRVIPDCRRGVEANNWLSVLAN